MESSFVSLCLFIGFLLIRLWPTWIDFICPLSFCSHFQCLRRFCSIVQRMSQLYFLSILWHLKILAIGPPALFTCAFWRIPRLTSCFSPPFWSWFEWWLPLLPCIRRTIHSLLCHPEICKNIWSIDVPYVLSTFMNLLPCVFFNCHFNEFQRRRGKGVCRVYHLELYYFKFISHCSFFFPLRSTDYFRVYNK